VPSAPEATSAADERRLEGSPTRRRLLGRGAVALAGLVALEGVAGARSPLSLSVGGESQDKAHFGDMDVLAWSWGASQSGSLHMGGGAGKANVQDLTITKYVESATVPEPEPKQTPES
jgi:hypothetical protein